MHGLTCRSQATKRALQLPMTKTQREVSRSQEAKQSPRGKRNESWILRNITIPPIDPSAKRRVVSQYPSASMSQILHTLPRLPANFDDGDVDSEASDDSNDSDGSDDFGEFLDDNDVGDEAETSPDNEASVKANNNAGDVKTATVLEWHPSAAKSLRRSYGSH